MAARRRSHLPWTLGVLALGAATIIGMTVASLKLPAPQPSPPVSTPAAESPVPAPTATPATGFTDEAYLGGNQYVRGVNIYSLIMGGYGEPQESYDYLASRGITTVRLAVPWQRLQRIPDGGTAVDGLNTPVEERYLEFVAQQVDRAGAAGIRTVLDLHNGCTYPWGAGDFVAGSVRCGDGITEDHVTYIWTTLANRFRDDRNVIAFNIFNEPRWSVGIDDYRRYSQVAVDAIRATGDQHSIWVEGILSDKRGRLAQMAPDGPWIVDPLNRIIYSEHFYADDVPVDQIAGTRTPFERLETFGRWCERWNVRCAIGEVGWPAGGDGGTVSAEAGEEWNKLFDRFYARADEFGMDVTYFAASGGNSEGPLLAYVSSSPGGPLDTALSQAKVIERHLARPAD